MTTERMTIIEDALFEVISNFNQTGIRYALGGSALLYYHGITDTVHDLDFIIHPSDIEKANVCMKKVGIAIAASKKFQYGTRHYKKYLVDGVEVDLMADLIIFHGVYSFEHHFDSSDLIQTFTVRGESVKLGNLEDWYLIYLFIGSREDKVKALEKHFIEQGDLNKTKMDQILNGDLPEDIRKRITNLLYEVKV